MQQPLISLITVVYNAEKVLEQTLQSAINQTYKNIELVIIDGGSKDSTLQIAEKFRSSIGTLISEKDKGIYDAMNKGVRAAKGEWVYFLNAGDSFYNVHVLENIFLNKDWSGKDFIYGKVQTVNEPTGVDYLNGKPVTMKDFYTGYPICHQATFTRRSIFETIGEFDISYKLAADTEWFIRIFKKDESRTSFVNEVVAFYDVQGASYHKRMQGYEEYMRFGTKHFPFFINLRNRLNYPLIWLKVKLIRLFTGTALFAYYRKLKFRNN